VQETALDEMPLAGGNRSPAIGEVVLPAGPPEVEVGPVPANDGRPAPAAGAVGHPPVVGGIAGVEAIRCRKAGPQRAAGRWRGRNRFSGKPGERG
jgi:hypothetical protein